MPATLRVLPRPTPGERSDTTVEVEIDEVLADTAARLEEWIAPRQAWTVVFRQGHDFGRANNVEAVVEVSAGELTSSVMFRLDQVDRVDEQDYDLLLSLEEHEGVTKLVRLTATGLTVEFFHILTFT
jgi:hypothetical protein